MTWPFYILALIAILASLRVITHNNPVHALLSMIVSLLAVAGIFFMLGAPFAGVLEVIVYAGAILVLFVFVVMMLNLGKQTAAREDSWLTSEVWAVPFALSFVLAVVLGFLVMQNTHGGATQIDVQVVGAKAVGTSLFTQYVLLVEVAAMLLLAALVAAYHLAKRSLFADAPDENKLIVAQESAAKDSAAKGNIAKSSDLKSSATKDSVMQKSGATNKQTGARGEQA